MVTRKEILKNRDRWIEAHEKTIALYKECVKEKSIDPFEEAGCALCVLADKVMNEMFSNPCDYCIYYSPYIKVNHCMDEESFKRIYEAYKYSITIERFMKERIAFHRNIIRKLKHAK